MISLCVSRLSSLVVRCGEVQLLEVHRAEVKITRRAIEGGTTTAMRMRWKHLLKMSLSGGTRLAYWQPSILCASRRSISCGSTCSFNLDSAEKGIQARSACHTDEEEDHSREESEREGCPEPGRPAKDCESRLVPHAGTSS